MRSLYLSFIALCVSVLAVVQGLQLFRNNSPAEVELLGLFEGDPYESLLALGARLPLGLLGIYELELLPQISEKLAQNILDKRGEIKAQANKLPAAENFKALEAARGIGPVKAKQLSSFIDPRQ